MSNKGDRPHEMMLFIHKPFLLRPFGVSNFSLETFFRIHSHALAYTYKKWYTHSQKNVSLWIPLRIGIIKSKFNLIFPMFKMGKNFKTLILLVSISLWIWSATTTQREEKTHVFGQREKDTFAQEWARCKEPNEF